MNAGLHAVLVFAAYDPVGPGTIADHEGTRSLKVHIQLPGQPAEGFICMNAEPALKRARLVVISGVYDACIGLGDPPCHIAFLLKYKNIHLVSCKVPGSKASKKTCPYDEHINFFHAYALMVICVFQMVVFLS